MCNFVLHYGNTHNLNWSAWRSWLIRRPRVLDTGPLATRN